jgi:hypothetical protein
MKQSKGIMSLQSSPVTRLFIPLLIFLSLIVWNHNAVAGTEDGTAPYGYVVQPSDKILPKLEKAIKEGKLDNYKYLLKKPDYEHPDVMELVKANWCQFKWKFAETALQDEEQQKKEGIRYKGFCPVAAVATRLNRRGEKRESAMLRWAKNYHLTDTGYDFKDLTLFLSPEDIRHMAVLVLDYLDPTRDQDTFLWLPSLRKVRRVAQAAKEDSFGGMDITYFDMVLREPEDEDHKILRTEIVGDELINQAKKENTIPQVIKYFESLRGKKVFVIESIQKRGFLSWHKRVWWYNPENGRDFRRLFYDKAGRLVKIYNISFRKTPFYGDKSKFGWSEDWHHVQNTLTGHSTMAYMPPLIFDVPVPDSHFTHRYLQRMK